jgi:hypothetical protein
MEISRAELIKRMQPGELSAKGFLGPGDDLDEVIARDADLLAEMGVSYEVLSHRLDSILLAGESNPGHKVHIGNFTVKVTVYNGFQQCPWTEDFHHSTCRKGLGASHASIDWIIRNKKTGQEMRGPGLIVHLIRDHRFFEGPGSPYRVEPLELARLLELTFV